jgi:hypothetical protein
MTFLATASGLIMERVLSIAMEQTPDLNVKTKIIQTYPS